VLSLGSAFDLRNGSGVGFRPPGTFRVLCLRAPKKHPNKNFLAHFTARVTATLSGGLFPSSVGAFPPLYLIAFCKNSWSSGAFELGLSTIHGGMLLEQDWFTQQTAELLRPVRLQLFRVTPHSPPAGFLK